MWECRGGFDDDVTSGISVYSRYEVLEKMLPDGLLSTVKIFSVQDSDFATYNCSAYNTFNATSLPIKFFKEGTASNFYRILFLAVRALHVCVYLLC